MKRFLTAVVGGLLTLAGIALLVLPGPGFVVIAAGLAVLSREFEWAARPLRFAQERANEGLRWVADRWYAAALDAITGLVLITAAVLDLTVGMPLLSPVSDGFIIASGLFLAGSVVYARTRPF